MLYIILLAISFIVGYLIGEWKQIDILDEKYFEKRWEDCD